MYNKIVFNWVGDAGQASYSELKSWYTADKKKDFRYWKFPNGFDFQASDQCLIHVSKAEYDYYCGYDNLQPVMYFYEGKYYIRFSSKEDSDRFKALCPPGMLQCSKNPYSGEKFFDLVFDSKVINSGNLKSLFRDHVWAITINPEEIIEPNEIWDDEVRKRIDNIKREQEYKALEMARQEEEKAREIARQEEEKAQEILRRQEEEMRLIREREEYISATRYSGFKYELPEIFANSMQAPKISQYIEPLKTLAKTELPTFKYLYIDPFTKELYVLFTIAAGDIVGLDNTCKTTTEMRAFFEGVMQELKIYHSYLQGQLVLMGSSSSNSTVDKLYLKQKIKSRQEQIKLFSETILMAKREVAQDGYLPLLEDALMDPEANLYPMSLSPKQRDPIVFFINNAVFKVRRDNSPGLGNTLRTRFEELPEIVGPKELLLRAVESAYGDSQSFQGENFISQIAKLKSFLNKEIFTRWQVTVSIESDKLKLHNYTEENFLKDICGLSDTSTAKQYASMLLFYCDLDKFFWDTLLEKDKDLNLFVDTLQTAINRGEALSILTQFFCAIVNIYCLHHELIPGNTDFGSILDAEEDLREQLAEKVLNALKEGKRVEQEIIAFFDENKDAFGLTANLSSTTKEEIVQLFLDTYPKINQVDDFDEFIIRMDKKKGNFASYKGNIVINFSQIASRYQTLSTNDKQSIQQNQRSFFEKKDKRLVDTKIIEQEVSVEEKDIKDKIAELNSYDPNDKHYFYVGQREEIISSIVNILLLDMAEDKKVFENLSNELRKELLNSKHAKAIFQKIRLTFIEQNLSDLDDRLNSSFSNINETQVLPNDIYLTPLMHQKIYNLATRFYGSQCLDQYNNEEKLLYALKLLGIESEKITVEEIKVNFAKSHFIVHCDTEDMAYKIKSLFQSSFTIIHVTPAMLKSLCKEVESLYGAQVLDDCENDLARIKQVLRKLNVRPRNISAHFNDGYCFEGYDSEFAHLLRIHGIYHKETKPEEGYKSVPLESELTSLKTIVCNSNIDEAEKIANDSVLLIAPEWVKRALSMIRNNARDIKIRGANGEMHHFPENFSLRDLIYFAQNEAGGFNPESGVYSFHYYPNVPKEIILALKDLVYFTMTAGKTLFMEGNKHQRLFLTDVSEVSFQQSYSVGRHFFVLEKNTSDTGLLDNIIFESLAGEKKASYADCQYNQERYIETSWHGKKAYFDTSAYKKYVAQSFVLAAQSTYLIADQEKEKHIFKYLAWNDHLAGPYLELLKPYYIEGIRLGLETLFSSGEEYPLLREIQLPEFCNKKQIAQICADNKRLCVFTDEKSLGKTKSRYTTATTTYNSQAHTPFHNIRGDFFSAGRMAEQIAHGMRDFSPVYNDKMQECFLSTQPPANFSLRTIAANEEKEIRVSKYDVARIIAWAMQHNEEYREQCSGEWKKKNMPYYMQFYLGLQILNLPFKHTALGEAVFAGLGGQYGDDSGRLMDMIIIGDANTEIEWQSLISDISTKLDQQQKERIEKRLAEIALLKEQERKIKEQEEKEAERIFERFRSLEGKGKGKEKDTQPENNVWKQAVLSECEENEKELQHLYNTSVDEPSSSTSVPTTAYYWGQRQNQDSVVVEEQRGAISTPSNSSSSTPYYLGQRQNYAASSGAPSGSASTVTISQEKTITDIVNIIKKAASLYITRSETARFGLAKMAHTNGTERATELLRIIGLEVDGKIKYDNLIPVLRETLTKGKCNNRSGLCDALIFVYQDPTVDSLPKGASFIHNKSEQLGRAFLQTNILAPLEAEIATHTPSSSNGNRGGGSGSPF